MDYFRSYGIETGRGKYHEEAIYGVALLYNLLSSRLEEYLAGYQLTIGKFNVLLAIRHQGGARGLSQVDISKRLIVSPANMTKLLDKLEDEQLVTRSSQEGDRRVKLIHITPKGEALLDRLWPGYLKVLQSLSSPINAGEQKAAAGVVKKWINALTAA